MGLLNFIGNVVGAGGGVRLPDTTSDGKQFFMTIGDSIARGSALDGLGPTPAANTVYGVQYSDLSLHAITTHDFGDYFVTPAAADVVGTQWPRFGIDYYTATGYKPVIFNAAVPTSTYAPDVSSSGSWDDAGSLYAAMKAKANTLLANNGLTRFKGIMINLGINDFGFTQTTGTIQTSINQFFTKLLVDFPNTPILVTQLGRRGATTVVAKLSAIKGMIKQKAIDNADIHLVGSVSGIGANGNLPDNIHPNIAGCNDLGSMYARWFTNSTYTKWTRSIVSSHFDSLSTTRKNLFESFISTIGVNAFLDIDCWYQFKTSNSKNVLNDLALLQHPSNVAHTFTINDSISFNGASNQRILSGVAPSITNFKSTQTDAFFIAKVKVNSVAAGTNVYLFGGNNGVIYIYSLQQSTSRLNVTLNSGTGSPNVIEDKYANDSAYGVSISGTTVAALKNGAVQFSATVATTGLEPIEIAIGGSNDNGVFNNAADLTGSLEYFIAGKASAVNQATLYAALEALVDGW